MNMSAQNSEIILGDLNSLIFGRIYSMPNKTLLVSANTYNYTDSNNYTKFYTLDENLKTRKIERKVDYKIDDILVFNKDSILLIYSTFNKYESNYLFIELVDGEFNSLNKDSIKIENKECNRAELFLSNEKIYFYCSNYTLSLNQSYITLGTIDKKTGFNDDVKTIETYTPNVEDILVTQQNDWIIFYRHYIVKMDANFNVTKEIFPNDDDMDMGYDSFWLSDKYYITGGRVGTNLSVMKSYSSNLVKRKQIILEENHTDDYPGGFDNVAISDSCFYFVGTTGLDSTDINFNPDFEKNYINVFCIDFELNVLWRKKFGGDKNFGIHSLCVTSDNGCAVVSAHSSESNYWRTKLSVTKLTKQGNIVSSEPNNKKNKLKIFPNPGNEVLNIELEEFSNTTYMTLYTITGKQIFSKKIDSFKSKLNVGALENGVYIYKVTNENDLINTGTWIKQ